MVITYDRNQQIEEKLKNKAIDLTFAQNTEEIGKNCAEQLIALGNHQEMERGNDTSFGCIPIRLQELRESKDES